MRKMLSENWRSLAFLALPILVAPVLACGDDGTGPENQPSENDGTALVGNAGGTVVSQDSVVWMTIPNGLVDSTTTFSIKRSSRTPPAMASGISTGVVYEFGPSGMEFDDPVEVEIHYSERLADLSFSDPSNLGFMLWGEDGSIDVIPSVVDPDAGTITASVRHFSWGQVIVTPDPWTVWSMKWVVSPITWHLDDRTPPTYLTSAILEDAFSEWRDAALDLEFEETEDLASANIVFREGGSLADCLGLVFYDVLGSACIGIDSAFESELEAEDEVLIQVYPSAFTYIANAYKTVRHEIGHALGLGHPKRLSDEDPIMQQGEFDRAELHQWDTKGVQHHYGQAVTARHFGQIAFTMMVEETYPAPANRLGIFLSQGDGRVTPLETNLWSVRLPVWSPAGEKIAFFERGPSFHYLWVINKDGSGARELTQTYPFDHDPGPVSWSPDGEALVYQTPYEQVRAINIDGSGERLLADGYKPAWSPTSDWIAMIRRVNKNGPHPDYNLWKIDRNGTSLVQLTSDPQTNEWNPAWSPDGSKIAYIQTIDWGETTSLWVMNGDGSDARSLGKVDGPEFLWSPEGTHLVYLRAGSAWVVNLTGTFHRRIASASHLHSWSGDGKEILITDWILHDYEDGAFLVDVDSGNRRRFFVLESAGLSDGDWHGG